MQHTVVVEVSVDVTISQPSQTLTWLITSLIVDNSFRIEMAYIAYILPG